jgi:hypothetical protein
MPHEDRDYYRTRASEERDRASTATDPAIAAIHFALASKYEDLVVQLGKNDPSAPAAGEPRAFAIEAGEPGMTSQ